MKPFTVIAVICFLLPFLVFFCVKFGTVAFYKAKQFIEKELKKENYYVEKETEEGKEKHG